MSFFAKSILPGGIRVLTESIPHVRSVTVGAWVGAGSQWEEPTNQGVSHLIEHLLFKGTTRRSARELAQAIDGRGGHLNAFTSKEHTCYYARVLDQHVDVAMDVLADMLQHSRFDPADLAKEKSVILEEMAMYEDVPDEVVHDLFAQALWPDHALGRQVVGTPAVVEGLARDEILAYFERHYTGENLVIAAAGNVAHAQVVEAVQRHFGALQARPGVEVPIPAAPAALSGPRARVARRDTEQVHMVLGYRGIPQEHPDMYALNLLATVLGGGATSRLFQTIREERGLAYSVYAYLSGHQHSGLLGVYAGTSSATAGEVLKLCTAELESMAVHGLTAEELHEAQEQLKGQIMLSLESTSGRMTRLGRGELNFGRVHSPDEIIARIERVQPEDVAAVAERLLGQQPGVLAVVGQVDDELLAGYPEVTEEGA